MKKMMVLVFAGSLVSAPLLALANDANPQVDRVIQAGSDYGITTFSSIEFDDDGRAPVEIEGWLDDGWRVELDMSSDGVIEREQRRRHSGNPQGLSASEVRQYLEAARSQGLLHIEEIEVKSGGRIKMEGEDQDGREMELAFQTGNTEPVRVTRDH